MSDREQRFIITIICALAAPVGTAASALPYWQEVGVARGDCSMPWLIPLQLHDPFGPPLFCDSVQALFIGSPPNHYFSFALISELMAPGGPGVGLDSN